MGSIASDGKSVATKDPLFHVLIDGESQGPFTLHQLRERLRRGGISRDTMSKPVADWIPLLTLMTEQQKINPASKWHLRTDDTERGPFAFSQLKSMWDMGAVTADSFGLPEEHWCPVGDIIEKSRTVAAPLHVNNPPIQTAVPPPLSRIAKSDSDAAKSSAVIRYFLPSGRIGRGMWFLRSWLEFIIFFGIAGLISQIPNAEILCLVPIVIWVYMGFVSTAKRLHDIGWTAWLAPVVIIPLANLVLLIFSGTNGANRYGPSPGNRFFV
jgi:uncharacterized membrane protein YhaH (DUF805 family)